MKHNEVGVQSKMKIVISLLRKQFSGVSAIESAIAAINYQGKKYLRLRGDITGTGVILGNVMILDVEIPLHTTNSSDVCARYGEFNMGVVRALTNGQYHVTDDKVLGNFGALNVGYVAVKPSRTVIVAGSKETTMSDEDIRKMMRGCGWSSVVVSEL